MKTIASITLLLLTSLLTSSGCYHEERCFCPDLKETQISIHVELLGNPRDKRLIVRTDKNFIKIDSLDMDFYADSYTIALYYFNHAEDESVIDYNYLIGNLDTGKVDTISNITYTPEPYTKECGQYHWFFPKTVLHCTRISNPQLTFNSEIINGFEVVLNE